MNEIDTSFVEPDLNCSNCDTEHTCFECESYQVRAKYPSAEYTNECVWVDKTNWVAWSYDSSPKDVAESILQEVNFILKDKGIIIDSYFDNDQEDYDFKLELNLR